MVKSRLTSELGTRTKDGIGWGPGGQKTLLTLPKHPTLGQMVKQTILCVDDEIDNVEALERLFRKKYHVLKATSAQQALEILAQHPDPISVIISDQRMPEMTGVEFFAQTQQSHPDIVRILLTGYTDLESIILAINQGQIYRYLTKPWEPLDLQNTVEHAIERFQLGQELAIRNKELELANQELKTLDQAKSHFMILINHELKTPLTSVLSFSALLAESKLSDEDKLMVNRIQKSADRLKSLVDDALLIVRADTGQLKIETQGIVIHTLDDLMNEEMQKLQAKKEIQIETSFVSEAALADGRLLKQVLRRLLHNALKFSLEKESVQISTQQIGSEILFQVSNKGPQITPKMIRKILNPFFTDEDIMHHSTGMGLGLSVSQAVLKAHGSTLVIQNSDTGVDVSFKLKALQTS